MHENNILQISKTWNWKPGILPSFLKSQLNTKQIRVKTGKVQPNEFSFFVCESLPVKSL